MHTMCLRQAVLLPVYHLCTPLFLTTRMNVSALFVLLFISMTGLNDAFESFVYAVFMSFVLMLLMEAIALRVVEDLKDAMLSVTFCMLVLGMMFLFAGYFLQVDQMLPVRPGSRGSSPAST